MIYLDELERKAYAALNPSVAQELINRLREAEKDAGRYRWLREKNCTADVGSISTISVDLQFQGVIDGSKCKKFPDCVDKAIDAAKDKDNG